MSGVTPGGTVRALLIRQRVSDYATWRRLFDADNETRRANGASGARVFRSSADQDEVWLLLGWDDLLRASLFVRSIDALDLLDRAEVIDVPDYWYLDEPGLPDHGA
jgi:hypothetical protein